MGNKIMKILFGFVTTMILLLCVSPSTVHAASLPYGQNLVANGVGDGNFTGWDTTYATYGDFLDETYTDAGLTASTNGGYIFDLLSSGALTQYVTQTIDISSISVDVSAGKVTLDLSAEIYRADNNDGASVIVEQKSSGGSLGTNSIVNDATGWQQKSLKIQLYPTTTQLIVTLKGDLATAGNPIAFDDINVTLSLLPIVTTQAVSSIGSSTATGNGNITNLGAPNPTNYGVCWSESTGPTILSNMVGKGTAGATGSFTADMTGLAPNTTYYVRAFATNTAGTSYGEEVSFTTAKAAPTVTTQPVSNKTSTTATGNGNITALGGANLTAYGICWSTSANPDTSNSKVDKGAISATGVFTADMTGLTPNTTYYVRAFATNEIDTSYGAQVSFTTSGVKPTVTTQAVTGIKSTTATGNGNITDLGVPNPYSYGVCWSTSSNPTADFSWSRTDKGAASATGAFTADIKNLAPNTTYYVRAYAKNSAGTSYGNEVTFTTGNYVAPTVTTQAVTDISATSATVNGNLTDLGDPNPSEYGICWSTSPTPTIESGSYIFGINATSTGAYTHQLMGLTSNTTYYVRAVATNAAGTIYGAEVSFTTATVPGAPTGVSATAGNGQATVSFTAPASNGGSTITGYTVTSNPGNITGTGTGTSIVVTGLTNGTAYTFTVTATNAAGTGSASPASNSITPATVPGAPTGVSATAGNGQATVNFTAPASNGGSTITGYTVTSNPGGLTGTGTETSIVVTGLTNGTAYTFRVTATNAVGTGSASSASNSITPATVPGAPTGVSATAGNGQATVNFTAPASNGGSTITGYTVTSNPGGLTGTGAGTSIVVTGLTNGTVYTFRVTATNAVGTGSTSSASNSVTPAIVPGVPTGVSATAGNGQATVSFTAPASNGGSAIIGYTVTSNPGNITGTGTGTSIVVTGLTNGTAYTFTVTATNAIGTGSASSASNSVTPVTVPGAPTGVSAAAGNGQATVSFTAPASNGGSAITGYTVTSNPGGLTGTGTETSIVVTGLTNGTAYTFRVTATNAVGTGSASSASNSITPATVPGAPTGVSATAGNGQATVNFTAPASNGGSTITGYTVTSNPGGLTGTGTGTSIVVTGLTNGTAYTFTVTARNAVGTGSASSASNSVTPATVPGAPTGVSAAAGNGQATISFTAPASNGGSAITGYTVTSNPGGLTGTGTGTSIVVTGLTNGTAYTFTVTARNAVGTGSASSASNSVTPATVPGAPTGVSATAGNGQATISFTAPASNGGSAITGYTVTSNPGGLTGTGTGTSIVVTGLTNGTAYTFTVTATNAQGNSVSSLATSAVTPFVPTSAPPAVAATPTVVTTDTKITIDVKQGESDKTATQITIDRKTDDKGKKADTVTFDSDKAAETVTKMTGSSETVARIIIPDTKDEVSETTVKIPTKAVEELAKGNVGLQIDTEDAKLNITQDSIQTASKNMDRDLYFNLVPLKNEEQKKELTERAVVQVGLISNTIQSGITVVGVPVAIETNIPSTNVNVTIPLTGITLPENPAQREEFLKQLAVYIEHSDGTKELVKGKIVEYKTGVMGIEFPVTKFSTFTIVHTDTVAKQIKSAACDIKKVVIPENALITKTKIKATVDNKTDSIVVKVTTSKKASWKLYSDKSCKKLLTKNKLKLSVGVNTVYLKITAENGTASKKYSLKITRKAE